jgi:HSP20 family protein
MASGTTMEVTRKRENAPTQAEHTRGGRVYSPHVDIVEAESELLLVADVPGAKPDSVDINYERGLLTLHVRVEPRQGEAETQFLFREYGIGDYHRCFEIGEGVDALKINAELRDGVLTVHLPKAEAVRPRKIQVKASS